MEKFRIPIDGLPKVGDIVYSSSKKCAGVIKELILEGDDGITGNACMLYRVLYADETLYLEAYSDIMIMKHHFEKFIKKCATK